MSTAEDEIAPLSLTELLTTPAIKNIYCWKQIEQYCPENMMFRDEVEKYKDLWANGAEPNPKVVKSRALKIFTKYCTEKSIVEINITRKEKAAIEAKLEALPDANMFDGVLYTVDRDIGVSLPGFWQSSVYRSYLQAKDLLNDLKENGSVRPKKEGESKYRARAGTVGYNDDRDEVLIFVRSAFNTEDPIIMTRQYDVSSPFHYSITSQADPDTQLGWAVQRGAHFYFYDMQEEEIIKVFGATLLGKTGLKRKADIKNEEEVDDDVAPAGGGCCGGGAAPTSPVDSDSPSASKGEQWFVRDTKGNENGPFSKEIMSTWWKYHMIMPHTQVRCNSDSYQECNDYDLFEAVAQISSMDPTQVATF